MIALIRFAAKYTFNVAVCQFAVVKLRISARVSLSDYPSNEVNQSMSWETISDSIVPVLSL